MTTQNKQNLINRSNYIEKENYWSKYLIRVCPCVLHRNYSVHLYTEPFVSWSVVVLETRQLLVPVPPEYCIFKMATICYYVSLNPMVQHFLPFQIVTVAVFRAFLYFLYLLTIPDSEIRKENRIEGIKSKGSAHFQEKDWQLWQMWVF